MQNTNPHKSARIFTNLNKPNFPIRVDLCRFAQIRVLPYFHPSAATVAFVVACCSLLAGCIPNTAPPGAKSATSVDPKLAQSEYWFNQPAIKQVRGDDYDQLWQACENTALDFSFTIDRVDYRTGLITSKPLISKQFFEPWKRDVQDFASQADSDTTTHRRVVHFSIRRETDGTFIGEPRVVVEHYAMPERRITAVYQYRDAFSTHRQYEEQANDDGTPVRVDYWYAERRDCVLERAMAARMCEYLHGTPPPLRLTLTSAP